MEGDAIQALGEGRRRYMNVARYGVGKNEEWRGAGTERKSVESGEGEK